TNIVSDEAASIKSQIAELDEIEDKIHKNRENIFSKQGELKTKQMSLINKIKERSRLQDELGAEDKQEKEQLALLTTKSKNLQELIEALQKKQEEKQRASYNDIKNNAISLENDDKKQIDDDSAFNKNRKLRIPASGKIVGRYGSNSDKSELSRGVTFKTRGSASVVAPYSGEVVYAGNFRDYGKMVIIRHGNDYHTLLSGMEKINCVPGQMLLKGEPIGNMGTAEDKTRLYMELRKNSKPIDPTSYL
ncbi:MAG: peptidoglycan DD-metalloendopeptidase family protein, partial [Pseudomonadota bacterium]